MVEGEEEGRQVLEGSEEELILLGSGFTDVIRSIPWFAWVAIVGIVGGTVCSVVSSRFRHIQRMEMIRKGMDPSTIKSADDD